MQRACNLLNRKIFAICLENQMLAAGNLKDNESYKNTQKHHPLDSTGKFKNSLGALRDIRVIWTLLILPSPCRNFDPDLCKFYLLISWNIGIWDPLPPTIFWCLLWMVPYATLEIISPHCLIVVVCITGLKTKSIVHSHDLCIWTVTR